MPNDSAVLLMDTRHVPGRIDESDHRDIERIAEADEPGNLVGSIDIDHAGENHRLLSDDPDGLPVQASKRDDRILSKRLVHLHHTAEIENGCDDVSHIVGVVRIDRHDCVQQRFHPPRIIRWIDGGWRFQTVQRQVREKLPSQGETLVLVVAYEVGHSTD